MTINFALIRTNGTETDFETSRGIIYYYYWMILLHFSITQNFGSTFVLPRR